MWAFIAVGMLLGITIGIIVGALLEGSNWACHANTPRRLKYFGSKSYVVFTSDVYNEQLKTLASAVRFVPEARFLTEKELQQ